MNEKYKFTIDKLVSIKEIIKDIEETNYIDGYLGYEDDFYIDSILYYLKENARLKDNWNKLNDWLEKQVKYLTEIDGQNIPLNDNFKFCSMNELYQTGKYSGFKETLEKIEVILKEN